MNAGISMSAARGRLLPLSDKDKSEAEGGRLGMSLVQIIQDYQQSSLRLREHTDRARKEAIRSAGRVSDLLVDAVNGGVEECFVNEKRIETEIRVLAATVARFAKHSDQWLAASHAINTAIKEIGDFENWMKTMEYDCKKITAAIRTIHRDP